MKTFIWKINDKYVYTKESYIYTRLQRLGKFIDRKGIPENMINFQCVKILKGRVQFGNESRYCVSDILNKIDILTYIPITEEVKNENANNNE